MENWKRAKRPQAANVTKRSTSIDSSAGRPPVILKALRDESEGLGLGFRV